MSDNGNNSNLFVREAPAPNRIRASGPILILAILFVVGAFLTWYLTWFGRELSDQDIATYLTDTNHPRKVQHALLQIQQRLDRKDGNTKQFYPRMIELASSSEPEIRLTIAWVMGFDNQESRFHDVLLKLLEDSQVIVRRNAALALVRFNDPSGHAEIRSILEPYLVRAPADGVLDSSLKTGAKVSRGTLLARVMGSANQIVEVRSPLPGSVEAVDTASNTTVATGQTVLKLRPDEESIWEALRALAVIGKAEDLPDVQRLVDGNPYSERIKEQAALTAKAIQRRTNS